MTIWQRAEPGQAQKLEPAKPSNSAMIIELAVLLLRVAEVALIIGIGFLLVELRNDEITRRAPDHYRIAALAAVIYAALAAAVGSYDTDVLISARRRAAILLRSWGVTGIFLVTLGFVMKATTDISREWSLVWFFSSGVALWLLRESFAAWLHSNKRAGLFDMRTAVFGGGVQAAELLKHLTGNDEIAISFVGRFDDRGAERPQTTELPDTKGELPALLRQIRLGAIDQVIVALPWSSHRRVQEIVQQLALTPVRIRLAPDLVGYAYHDKPITLLGDVPVVTIFDRPISGLDQSIKWLEDQVLGWTLLIVLSPVLLLIALAIKLESPGPVFFRQLREGFNDGQFRVWKFRSMHHSASEWDSITQASVADPRVTRVGAFLRRWSLDELPQLFNVVSGEMSLVGPRPHAPSTKAGQRLFRDAISTYAARHRVKPGVTGWAQVRGWRGPTDTEEKLAGRL